VNIDEMAREVAAIRARMSRPAERAPNVVELDTETLDLVAQLRSRMNYASNAEAVRALAIGVMTDERAFTAWFKSLAGRGGSE